MGIGVTDEGGFSKTVLIVWGILAIVGGFFLVTRPATTGVIFVEVMAIFWVVGGIIDFIRAIAQRGDLWGLRLTFAIISFIAGLYILGSPILGTMYVIHFAYFFLAISALIYGIFNIIAGFRNEDGTSWAAVIIGVIQILIGIWMFGYPYQGTLTVIPVLSTVMLTPILGIFMIVGGILAIIASFFNSGSSGAAKPPAAPAAEPPAETAA
jgi:uncharacterized membrane protein HdeD (DUF308 family)